MNYNEDTINQASQILRKRKRDAELIAEKNHDLFITKYPKALEIEKILQATGSQAAIAVLSGGDVREQLDKLRTISLELQKEYAELLNESKMTNDDIEPQYTCKICSDTGYKDGFMCSCQKEILKKITYDKLNQLTPLEYCTFSNYSLDYFKNFSLAQENLMKKNYNYCKHYAETFSLHSDNILLNGATGLGKTHLSLAIANEAIKKGFGVIYGSVQSFAVSIEKSRYSYNEETDVNLSICDLLILDDLGAELPSPYAQSVIYNIINTRIMRKIPTIISTNLTPEEIQKRYGERMISRFFGSYNSLQFVGKDIRVIRKFNK